MTEPEAIAWHRQSNTLELVFDGDAHHLSAEFLRVHSPSAEVKGHHGQGGSLPFGKSQVKLIEVKPIGHYALSLAFDDGHNSGIYSWYYLKDLCDHHERYWQEYLNALHQEGLSREAGVQVIQIK